MWGKRQAVVMSQILPSRGVDQSGRWGKGDVSAAAEMNVRAQDVHLEGQMQFDVLYCSHRSTITHATPF
jgi:hypothetical protein